MKFVLIHHTNTKPEIFINALLDQTISYLHNFLTSSGYYLLDEDTGTSEQVFTAWNDRLLTALQEDFVLNAQVNLSFTDAYFELFGDQGATVWGVKATTVVSYAEPGFSFWVKCIINYQQAKAYLTEAGQRLNDYPGNDQQLKKLFRRFKAVQQSGYESTILVSELLGVRKD